MAHDPAALADLVKVNDMNISEADVSDLLQGAPFISALAAETASNGTDHKYLKETGAPVVGFRSVNDGRDHDSSEDTLVTINLKILDATFHVDRAVADSYTKGGADGWIAREARRHLRAAFAKGEKQLIYGTDDDSDGFTGLADASTIDAVADAMVVNAGGSTADTQTSVFAIRSVPEGNDCTLIVGQDGNLEIGDRYEQLMQGATGHFPTYVTPIYAWMGLQIGSAYSVGRIANIHPSDANAQLDDDKISDLLSLFPADRPATHLVMNRSARKMLQQSRTATNTTGAPAPFPMESFDVPIITTDQIVSTEAVLT